LIQYSRACGSYQDFHNFSPGIKITTDKFKLLGIIIPTNGKQKDLIEENYYNKKKKY
jgi:hypothetical protein